MAEISIYRAFQNTAGRYADRVCLVRGTEQLTYAEVSRRVRALAAFLQRGIGVKPGEAVAVLADNCHDWLIVSLAIQAVGAIEFPRPQNLSRTEVRELCHRTRCRVFFFANVQTMRQARRHLPALRNAAFVIAEGQNVVSPPRTWQLGSICAIQAETDFREFDFPVSAVILTSGTTGSAKWVPVLQRSYLHSMRVIPRLLAITERDVFLSCLPSWHLYARLVEYVAIGCGARIVYSGIPELGEMLKNSGATIFPSFPEIWEQIYHRILGALETSRGARFKQGAVNLVRLADRVYERWFGLVRHESKRVAFLDFLKLAYLLPLRWLLQRLVFRRVRAAVSPRLRYAIMGDAPLPLAVDETLRAFGFQVLEGYGSTEQCVTAFRRPARNFPGAVGRVLPGVHVRIDDREGLVWNGMAVGEILVQGDNVFAGYFESLQSLGAVAPEPAYYASGDIGTVDSDGNLIVIGRRVNAFYLARGELVFPELVENVLRGSRYVGRVLLFGAAELRPCAIIVPDFTELYRWAVAAGHLHANPAYLQHVDQHAEIWKKLLSGAALTLYREEFAALIADSGLPAFAVPADFYLVPHPFHRGSELTPTLKPRRTVIAKRYARELGKMFRQL